MQQFLDIFLNVDQHLDGFVTEHGVWVYVLLFAIIFAETGLVVMPFLPGDSLLFAAGAIAARGSMNVMVLCAVLIVAAIIGDAVNYHVGRFVGPKVFSRDPSQQTGLSKLLNRKHLDRAHAFFEKHGGKAVVLARFVPIVRTFVPFVAGAGAMNYGRFVLFNVVGGVAWVAVCVGAGYMFGNIPWVKKNFEFVVIGIIVVSLIPLVIEFVAAKRSEKRSAHAAS